MADKASLDFETASAAELRRVGLYRYAEDPSTRIWLFSYRFGKEPVQRWRPGDAAPERLLSHIQRGGTVGAFNANFERQIWNNVLRRHEGLWPRLEIAQLDDTMARALAIHLPADLDTLAVVLGLKENKDSDGSALMRKMAKPRKIHADGSVTWWDSPENLERLGAYCDQDVIVEGAVDEVLPPLSADERELWELDQRINDRGISIDLNTVEHCVAVLEVAQARANARMAALTNGAVAKCSEARRIVEWLKTRGIPAESIAKDEHKDLLRWADMFGDDAAKEVIELRAEAGKSSTAKFSRMQEVVCADGRARGLLAYHRASTGRWGGALLQPQNLPRCDEETELPDVLGALEIMAGA